MVLQCGVRTVRLLARQRNAPTQSRGSGCKADITLYVEQSGLGDARCLAQNLKCALQAGQITLQHGGVQARFKHLHQACCGLLLFGFDRLLPQPQSHGDEQSARHDQCDDKSGDQPPGDGVQKAWLQPVQWRWLGFGFGLHRSGLKNHANGVTGAAVTSNS